MFLDLALTGDPQAFVVRQFFSEEPGNDQLRALHEEDLFLDQSSPEHSSTYHLGSKIHLSREKEGKKKNMMTFHWVLLWYLVNINDPGDDQKVAKFKC